MTTTLDTTAINLQRLRQRIQATCVQFGRDVHSVTLMGVSKTQSAAAVDQAVRCGVTVLGENYVQEGLAKIEALKDRRDQLHWHLIGPLQSNKAKYVAQAFDGVQSIDRLSIAQALAKHRPEPLPPLEVLVQVNVGREASKSGVLPEDALALCEAVAALPRLNLRGLMAIPEPGRPEQLARMHALWRDLQARGLQLPELSMGMSNDLEAAIQHGSTCVRVGTALFGERSHHAARP